MYVKQNTILSFKKINKIKTCKENIYTIFKDFSFYYFKQTLKSILLKKKNIPS